MKVESEIGRTLGQVRTVRTRELGPGGEGDCALRSITSFVVARSVSAGEASRTTFLPLYFIFLI